MFLKIQEILVENNRYLIEFLFDELSINPNTGGLESIYLVYRSAFGSHALSPNYELFLLFVRSIFR